MAKYKTSRTNRAPSEFVLFPSRVRMTIIYAVLFTLALMIGLLIRAAFSGWSFDLGGIWDEWYLNILLIFGGALVFAMIDYNRWTIRVRDNESVEGPTGAMGERALLPIKNIDWDRTRRNLNSRLKIGNAIYTQSGQRILISPWFYAPARYHEFLSEIGYTPTLKAL